MALSAGCDASARLSGGSAGGARPVPQDANKSGQEWVTELPKREVVFSFVSYVWF
jgi:hypothetical protein